MEKKSFSVLQADEVFVKKILARNSSVGNHSSDFPESFRPPAEVPFKWETRPGEPKDPPKEIELTRPDPIEPDTPQSPPRPAPRAAAGPALSRASVLCFLKKLVDKGNKYCSVYKSNSDRGSSRSDQRFTSRVGPSSSNSSFSHLGFSTTPSSPTPCSSSKLQTLSWGCIKSAFVEK